MKYLVQISRILVGSLFIVSGMIKANDAMGFAYKLEKYFAPGVLDLPFLVPYALTFSIIVCVAEIILGFATLIGGKMKLTSWTLLLLIIFFTWLTFYSAYFGVVKDCGCFGDALKLTPWQSFYKDLILLLFVLIIFINRSKIEFNNNRDNKIIFGTSIVLIGITTFAIFDWGFPLYFTIILIAASLLIKNKVQDEEKAQWGIAGTTALFTLAFVFYTTHYLPIKDYRPYAVGNNIPKNRVGCDYLPDKECPEYATEYFLKNKKTNEIIQTNSKDYIAKKMHKNSNLKIDSTGESIKIEEGYEPPIHDFIFQDNTGENVTQKIIGDTANNNKTGYVFLVVAYDLKNSDSEAFNKLADLSEKINKNGYKMYGATSSSYEKREKLRHDKGLMFEFFTADAVMLKTIVRSNPGLLLLKDGIIKGKWSSNCLPDYDELEKKYL